MIIKIFIQFSCFGKLNLEKFIIGGYKKSLMNKISRCIVLLDIKIYNTYSIIMKFAKFNLMIGKNRNYRCERSNWYFKKVLTNR